MLSVRGVKEVKAVQKIAVEETRLGIPLIIGFDVIHGYKTLSPIPLAESSSWDMKAIEKSAEVAGSEGAGVGNNQDFRADDGYFQRCKMGQSNGRSGRRSLFRRSSCGSKSKRFSRGQYFSFAFENCGYCETLCCLRICRCWFRI